jgi:hypothetical protein
MKTAFQLFVAASLVFGASGFTTGAGELRDKRNATLADQKERELAPPTVGRPPVILPGRPGTRDEKPRPLPRFPEDALPGPWNPLPEPLPWL